MESIIHLPDEVCSVICQMMAKPTTEEPKSDIFWLIKKSAAFFRHESSYTPPKPNFPDSHQFVFSFINFSFSSRTCSLFVTRLPCYLKESHSSGVACLFHKR